ncbi:hypothetical protein [Companilactobacillus bobalius]|nr:hypothetical protein [Companilactobacillus bobalius]KAE9560306.1 hypothetical protein ATN92_09055 [Companilactobacillus bobalius]OVE99267.1 hypothetical protein LKACC16343_00379 [Companilactobacillus bobalius]GEO57245.1 hypothetical protein LBO01_03740 [Companilactobacillus paralimentarius]
MKPTDWISAISAVTSALAAIIALYISNSNSKNNKKYLLKQQLEDIILIYRVINNFLDTNIFAIKNNTSMGQIKTFLFISVNDYNNWLDNKILTATNNSQLELLRVGRLASSNSSGSSIESLKSLKKELDSRFKQYLDETTDEFIKS